jgi:c-di-GMP-binding flagellar brake protein YcgR
MDMHKGRIEQRRFERVVAQMAVRFYVLDAAHADALAKDAAYRETALSQMDIEARPETLLKGVTRDISAGGFCLLSDSPLEVGTPVMVDMEVPGLPRPLRALSRVMRRDTATSRDSSGSSQVWVCGLAIEAINKEDLRRIENLIIEMKLKQGK